MENINILSKGRINLRKKIISSIDCSPCGKFIVSANRERNNIMTYDLTKSKIIAQSAKIHSLEVLDVRYSPNGIFIASGSCDGSIIIWNAATLIQFGKTLLGHEEEVMSLAFSPDTLYMISGGWDKIIRIWNCQIQEQVGEGIKTDYPISSVEYSPDGLQIISAGHRIYMNIWNAQNGQHIRKLVGHKDWVSKAIYSLDGRFIASCSADHSIKIWNASSGQQIGNDLLGHVRNVSSIAISLDCSIIVSGSWDQTVRIWNFSTQRQECSELVYKVWVREMQISRNGKYIISVTDNGSMCASKIIQNHNYLKTKKSISPMRMNAIPMNFNQFYKDEMISVQKQKKDIIKIKIYIIRIFFFSFSYLLSLLHHFNFRDTNCIIIGC